MSSIRNESDLLKKETGQIHKLLRIKEVVKLTGISKSYIYQLSSQNIFPKSIQLIPGGSSVAWIESEVFDWINSRIQERDEEAA